MALHGVRQINQASAYGIWSAPKGGDSGFTGGFHQNLEKQLKDYYKNCADTLFDEINRQAAGSFSTMDLTSLERYRRLIKELVGEVVNNAFAVNRELITDGSGKQRSYLTIRTIDEKLDQLVSDVLGRNIERLEFIGRVDEIRGLVMDMLM